MSESGWRGSMVVVPVVNLVLLLTASQASRCRLDRSTVFPTENLILPTAEAVEAHGEESKGRWLYGFGNRSNAVF